MATVNELADVFDRIVEAQMPPTDALPPGMSSADWLLVQRIANGRIDPSNGKIVGFKPDGMDLVVKLAKSMRAGNPAYARGTRLRSFIEVLVTELVKLRKGSAGGGIAQQDLTAFEAS